MGQKVTCPWCGEETSEYEKHLMDKHYKKEGEKLIGPFPAGVKAE